jgi:flagellar motor switch protein FliG
MGVDRYSRDDEGFRKYVELIESTPTAKRQTFIDSAKAENPQFAEAAEKYMLTFERIVNLPEMEITEVFAAPELKADMIAVAICSVEDAGVKEKLTKHIPRTIAPRVHIEMKENPKPKAYDIGGARLKIIMAARDLEKRGKLKSMQIPKFGAGYFRKKAA